MKRRDTCTPMFLAAMATIAKLWKEPRCPLKDEWIKKMWFMYTMEYYSAIRNDKYPPFASTWMELEGIMLSEQSAGIQLLSPAQPQAACCDGVLMNDMDPLVTVKKVEKSLQETYAVIRVLDNQIRELRNL
ncbi:LINE-1 retrotransposable element ORF2 protein [Vulpes lagopus]